MISGIYTITNVINNKIYVGYTNNLQKRIYEHIWNLSANSHDNEYLQNSYNKYGDKSFKFEILEECEERFMMALEHYWCNILNTHNRDFGYNILPTHPNKKSYAHSEETKRKISIKNKGKKGKLNIPREQVTKDKISRILKSRPHKNRKRIICNNTGKIFNSITEAKDHFKVGKTTISNIVNRKFKKNKTDLDLSWY